MNRKLPVSFRDAQNLPLQNVSVSDLEAKMHGKALKIVSLTPDDRPHRLVIIMDASGGMGPVDERSSWTLEVSLARHFFEVNRERAQIGLLFFNDRPRDQVSLAQGNAAVGEMLSRAANDRDFAKNLVRERTALFDAIFQGIQMLDHPTSADAVYVLTDGWENVSKHSFKEVDEQLAATSVRMFAVLLFQGIGSRNRTPKEISRPDVLNEVARKSGGEILTLATWQGKSVALTANSGANVRSEETLSRLYQTILEDRLLEIELPIPIAKSERWEMKLSEAARRKWKKAQITYPSILLGCSAEVSGTGRY